MGWFTGEDKVEDRLVELYSEAGITFDRQTEFKFVNVSHEEMQELFDANLPSFTAKPKGTHCKIYSSDNTEYNITNGKHITDVITFENSGTTIIEIKAVRKTATDKDKIHDGMYALKFQVMRYIMCYLLKHNKLPDSVLMLYVQQKRKARYEDLTTIYEVFSTIQSELSQELEDNVIIKMCVLPALEENELTLELIEEHTE